MTMSSVLWLAGWSAVAIAGVSGAIISANNIRFERRVEREANAMIGAAVRERLRIAPRDLEEFPSPVRRYLTEAIGSRGEPIRSIYLEQTGTFRPDLNGRWFPIRGRQYFTSAPPAFVWWGRVRIAPGVWIEARDRSVDGIGNMLIVAESTLTLANASGPGIDQGALLRLLGELVWMPTAFLDRRYIRWTAVDDRHAQATIIVKDHKATGTFEFGNDGLPVRFTADRFRDMGDGKSVLTPFVGECHDYREAGGLVIPHELVGSWVIDGAQQPYARFQLAKIEFDH